MTNVVTFPDIAEREIRLLDQAAASRDLEQMIALALTGRTEFARRYAAVWIKTETGVTVTN